MLLLPQQAAQQRRLPPLTADGVTMGAPGAAPPAAATKGVVGTRSGVNCCLACTPQQHVAMAPCLHPAPHLSSMPAGRHPCHDLPFLLPSAQCKGAAACSRVSLLACAGLRCPGCRDRGVGALNRWETGRPERRLPLRAPKKRACAFPASEARVWGQCGLLAPDQPN